MGAVHSTQLPGAVTKYPPRWSGAPCWEGPDRAHILAGLCPAPCRHPPAGFHSQGQETLSLSPPVAGWGLRALAYGLPERPWVEQVCRISAQGLVSHTSLPAVGTGLCCFSPVGRGLPGSRPLFLYIPLPHSRGAARLLNQPALCPPEGVPPPPPCLVRWGAELLLPRLHRDHHQGGRPRLPVGLQLPGCGDGAFPLVQLLHRAPGLLQRGRALRAEQEDPGEGEEVWEGGEGQRGAAGRGRA